MKAYQCDGCQEYFDLHDDDDPPFTIQRNGILAFGDTPEFHAHSWECLVRIALRHTTEQP